MENDNQQLAIRELQSVYVPLLALRAALTCASDEQTRLYLNGVFVHATEIEYRVVATDGHRMLVYSTPLPTKGGNVLPTPPWLAQGVIIPREGLKERLALLAKVGSSDIEVAFQIGAPHLVLSDVQQSCIFKMRPVDGTFSEYQRILDRLKVFESRSTGDMASIHYDSGYLKGVGEIAKLLDSDSVRVFGIDGGDHAEPTLVTFPGCSEALLVLMPMSKGTAAAIGAGAARMLSGAVAGTVAALRAHRTRCANVLGDEGSSKRAKAEAEKKVAEYDRRIEAIVTNAAKPALPPPPDPFEVFSDAVRDGLVAAGEGGRWEDADEDFYHQLREWFGDELPPDEVVAKILAPVSYALADAIEPEAEPVHQEPSPVDLALYRRKLKKGARRQVMARFCADLNAVLSAEHQGLTLSQLADGVPVDDWFDTGLTPAEAAKRCLDWRRIGAVLPPDEVLPGEQDKPVGLLQSTPRPTGTPEDEAAVKLAEYRVALNAALVSHGAVEMGGSENAIRRRILGMIDAGLTPEEAARAWLELPLPEGTEPEANDAEAQADHPAEAAE